MNSLCRIQSQTRNFFNDDTEEEAELYSLDAQGDYFSIRDVPRTKLLHQNMGPSAAMFRMRRHHEEGEFLLEVPARTYVLFSPMDSGVIITDRRLRRFRLTQSNHLCTLGPGRYSVIGCRRNLAYIEAHVVRFRKADVLYWGRHGYLPYVHLCERGQYDPVWFGLDFMYTTHLSRPHTLLTEFLHMNLHFHNTRGLYRFLLNGPLAGVSCSGFPREVDCSPLKNIENFARQYTMSKRGKGLSIHTHLVDVLEAIKGRNLSDLTI